MCWLWSVVSRSPLYTRGVGLTSLCVCLVLSEQTVAGSANITGWPTVSSPQTHTATTTTNNEWLALLTPPHSCSLLLTAGQTQLEAGCVLSVFPDWPGLAWPGSMWWHSQTWLSCPDWQSCGAAWPAGVRSLSPPPVTLDWLDSPGWPGWPAPEISRQILSRSLLSLSHNQYWPPPGRGQLCRLGDPGGGGAEWDRGVGSQDVVQSVSRAACSSRLQEGQGTS